METTKTPLPGNPQLTQSTANWVRIDWICVVFLILGCLLLTALHNNSYKTLSPIDELQHLDFTLKASAFHFPGVGERVGDQAMQEAACRSVDAPGYVGPACTGGPYSPSSFQELGYNTAASQLPTYYLVTGVIGRLIRAFTPVDSFVSAFRLTGGLFLGSAFAVLWYLMGIFSISRLKRLLPILLLAFTPIVIFHSSTINADAALMLCGTIALLSFVKFEMGSLSGIKLLLISFLLFSVDQSVALAIVAAAIGVAAGHLVKPSRNLPKLVILITVFVILFMSYKFFFPQIHDFLQPQVGPIDEVPMFNAYKTPGVQWNRVLQQLGQVVTPVWNTYLPPFFRTEGIRFVITITNWLLIGSLLHSMVSKEVNQTISRIAGSTFIMMVLAGPIYTLIYAIGGSDFAAPGRFGLCLLPFIAIPVAKSLDKKTILVAYYALAIFGVFLTSRAIV